MRKKYKILKIPSHRFYLFKIIKIGYFFMVPGGTNWNIYFSDNEGTNNFSFILGFDINEMWNKLLIGLFFNFGRRNIFAFVLEVTFN